MTTAGRDVTQYFVVLLTCFASNPETPTVRDDKAVTHTHMHKGNVLVSWVKSLVNDRFLGGQTFHESKLWITSVKALKVQ